MADLTPPPRRLTRRQFQSDAATGAAGAVTGVLTGGLTGAAVGMAAGSIVLVRPEVWADAVGDRNRDAVGSDGDWIVHSEVPANREVPLRRLIGSWITPVDRFYVRSHAAVPKIDPADYRLAIGGMVDRPAEWSLTDLAGRFEKVTVTATMTCAGNRRYEHSRTRQVSGVPWQEGAIGNANWSGYRLADVLAAVGVRSAAEHVWFDGVDRIDRDGGTIGFGASIPMAKLSRGNDAAILCTEMNGAPLTGDHGYPLRTVVPGYIGARSVKWLGRVTLSNRPNPNHYQSTAYKVVTETDPIDWAEAAPIYRFAINAVIAAVDRRGGDDAVTGRTTVRGYALPPGDPAAVIDRVELSTDNGATWTAAKLIGPSRPLCWQLWRCELSLPKDVRSLLVRGIDNRGRVQPRHTDWNKKGYMFNAQHQVGLEG